MIGGEALVARRASSASKVLRLSEINTSAAPLKYLSISTRDSPEVVEYPDSGKYLATASGPLPDGTTQTFGRMHREADDLDYWDGEP